MVDNFQRYGYAGYSYWDPKDDFSHHDAVANQFILTPYYDLKFEMVSRRDKIFRESIISTPPLDNLLESEAP